MQLNKSLYLLILFSLSSYSQGMNRERRDSKRCVQVLRSPAKSGTNTYENCDFKSHPIHVAIGSNNLEIVRQILSASPEYSLNICDWQKRTPLHLAARSDTTGKIIALFLSYGAKINEKDFHGNTPLHLAAQAGNVLALKLLCLAGADKNVINNDGFTLLHCAVSQSNNSAVQFLIEQDAAIESFNNDDNTPLELAVRNCEEDVITSLLEAGAVPDRALIELNSRVEKNSLENGILAQLYTFLLKRESKNRQSYFAFFPHDVRESVLAQFLINL